MTLYIFTMTPSGRFKQKSELVSSNKLRKLPQHVDGSKIISHNHSSTAANHLLLELLRSIRQFRGVSRLKASAQSASSSSNHAQTHKLPLRGQLPRFLIVGSPVPK